MSEKVYVVMGSNPEHEAGIGWFVNGYKNITQAQQNATYLNSTHPIVIDDTYVGVKYWVMTVILQPEN